jgi:hydroxymethylbilane synthase
LIKIRLAARGSALSLVQVHAVARMLAPYAETEITTYKTTGDRLSQLDAVIVGKGVFTKEIDEALLDGRADLGVHSLKDLPSELPDGLALTAVPKREDPSDALISRPRVPFAQLPRGARVGTGSPRRRAQLLAARPDLVVTEARGNVDTRIRRLEEGKWDAIVLARAGLARLGRLDEICDLFSQDVMLPAIGQGALALVARKDDADTARALAPLDHAESHTEVLAERALLRGLEGGCRAPMAARATALNGTLRLAAVVFSVDGARCLREEGEQAAGGDPEALGEELARRLRERGADRLLGEARQ